jgi:Rrf2 family cysteine metabolism transcriptional repressor
MEVDVMKLSTKGRYGTRALLEIALHEGREPILLRDIASRQQISLSYLEHIISPLIAGGIIRSTKGPRGGISLNRKPSEVKLSEVIQLLEGSVAPADCVDNPDICDRSSSCVTRDLWKEIKDVMSEVLESTTLQDLVERQKKKDGVGKEMYQI